MKKIFIAMSICMLLGVTAFANLDILVIGSSHSFSERGEYGVVKEKAFDPNVIAAQLNSILANDPAITEPVNVVVEDIFKTKTMDTHVGGAGDLYSFDYQCLSLAQHYMWPEGKTNRLANLRGEAGTAWDYVVIMADPYIMANMSGMYSEGVTMLIDEIGKGTAQPLLLAQWPENSSSFSASLFNEIVYRTGDSANVPVVPAGLAWESLSSQDTSTQHPTPHGAYLAASCIYSEMYNKSAKTSGHSYNDSIADHALATVQASKSATHYTGAFSHVTPFSMKYVTKRYIRFNHTGSSSENGITGELGPAISRCNVSYTKYGATNTWPVGIAPIDFNFGRANDWFEDDKDYHVDTNCYDRSYGFPMQDQGDLANTTMLYGIDKRLHNGSSYHDGTDLCSAYNMIRPGTRELGLPLDVRCVPIRLMWSKISHVDPTLDALPDNWHMSAYMNEASSTFIYTLLSGRCPVGDEPSPANTSTWYDWLGRKIGYETAWRMSHATTRAPGFQVLPTAWNATNVTPSSSQTLSVRFVFAPTSDVTVAVSTDDRFAGKASPSVLTFTPSNYTNAQTVAVFGETGLAGTYEFNVILTTSSADPVYESVTDSWSFSNTRPDGPAPSDLRVLGNGFTVLAGDMTPDAAVGTDFGIVQTAMTNTFVITNLSDSIAIDLTNSPRVTLEDASGYFSLAQDAVADTLAAGESTTFKIDYTPLAMGVHAATVTVASTDASVPEYTFAIKGSRQGPPLVSVQGATSADSTSAELSGLLTAGVAAEAWFCWGTSDAGTNSMGDWEFVVPAGNVEQDLAFNTMLNGLLYGIVYDFRVFVTNSHGQHWSAVDSFTTSVNGASPPAVSNTAAANILSTSADLVGVVDCPGAVLTVSVYYSTNNNATPLAWQNDTAASSVLIGTYTNVSGLTVTQAVSSLTALSRYYYTFAAVNEVSNYWPAASATFALASAPEVGNATGATAVDESSATLRGELTTGGGASAWICWGASDGGSASTGDWDAVASIGSVAEGSVFSCTVTGLETNRTYWYRCYVDNAYGSDWSDEVTTFSGTPASTGGGGNLTAGINYYQITSDSDCGITNTFTYTHAIDWGSSGAATVNGVVFVNDVNVSAGGRSNSGTRTYGPSSHSGNTAPAVSGSVESLFHDMRFNGPDLGYIELTGLTPGKWYDVRLYDRAWDYYGDIRTFNAEFDVGGDGSAEYTTPTIDQNRGDLTPPGMTGNVSWAMSYIYKSDASGKMRVTIDLLTSTTYHLYALTNEELSDPAAIKNSAPDGIDSSGANLNASLNASGTNYNVYVFYGPSDGGSNAGAWVSSALVGSWTNVSTNVSYSASLSAGQTYYYTFMVSNATETLWAAPSWRFATPGDATVPLINSSEGAVNISGTGALLNGWLTSTGAAATTVSCYWNANSDPGTTTIGWDYSRDFGVASGTGAYTNDTSETAALLQGTTYYYRYRAANIYGTNWSSAVSFTTLLPPVVNNSTGATALSETSATLRGELTVGSSASIWICWGATDAGTSGTGVWDNVVSIGSVGEGITFSNVVSSLDTNKTYWYRCYASNLVGDDWSDTATTFSGTPASTGGGGGDVVVGINFRRSTGVTEMPSSDAAGAIVVHSNWNNSDGSVDGTTANISSPTAAALEDSSGATTDLNIFWDFGTTFSCGNSGNPDERMMSGYLDNNTGTSTITVSNITAGSFDVYVYVGSDADNRNGTIGIDGAETYSFNTHSSSAKSFPGDYLLTTDTGTLYPDANYAVWSNLTGTAFTVRHTRVAGNNGVHGMQVVLKNTGSAIANLAPDSITAGGANMNASVDASGTNYDLYVFYGPSDGGSNASSWVSSALVGSWTNVSTNVSYTASLAAGQTYYYAFMASNATEIIWAAPSWTFGTPGARQVTVNHAVPHAWLQSINASWTNDYEYAATNDADGDGFSTAQEYWSGTDPADSNSYLRLGSTYYDGTNIHLEWQHSRISGGIPPISIQSRPDLSTGQWTEAGQVSPVNGANNWSEFSAGQGFYRLCVTNMP